MKVGILIMALAELLKILTPHPPSMTTTSSIIKLSKSNYHTHRQ
jgi:hypothetical protein